MAHSPQAYFPYLPIKVSIVCSKNCLWLKSQCTRIDAFRETCGGGVGGRWCPFKVLGILDQRNETQIPFFSSLLLSSKFKTRPGLTFVVGDNVLNQ